MISMTNLITSTWCEPLIKERQSKSNIINVRDNQMRFVINLNAWQDSGDLALETCFKHERNSEKWRKKNLKSQYK